MGYPGQGKADFFPKKVQKMEKTSFRKKSGFGRIILAWLKSKSKSKSKSNLFATTTQNKIKIEQRLQ